jgi:16S rRNA (guanine(966)-N(2))-methyltransferase RsmD
MYRMRESIFASLGELQGRSFLDLFSGSGIIALEAASRGASPVEAVEKDPLKRRILRENLALSPEPIRCRCMAVELYARRAKGPFDVIFCDPPFPYRFRGELIASIAASPLMEGGSLLLLHRPREKSALEKPEGLALEESRQYGRSVVDFFRLRA